MSLTNEQLSDESARATELLSGKVLLRIVRHRESEVLLEFADGARLFLDHSPNGVELSITGTDSK